MVRLLPLRDDGRPRVSAPLFPEVRPADRDPEQLRDLLRRLSRAADRRLAVWDVWRPHRAQGDPDRDPPGDGNRDLPDRRHADLLQHRAVGGRVARHLPPLPGHRRRRRVGRLGAHVHGVGEPEAQGIPWQLASVRRSCGAAALDGDHGPNRHCLGIRDLRGVGLENPVPAQHRSRSCRSLHPAGHPRDPGVQLDRGSKSGRASSHHSGHQA